jgi:hypothetical protein
MTSAVGAFGAMIQVNSLDILSGGVKLVPVGLWLVRLWCESILLPSLGPSGPDHA